MKLLKLFFLCFSFALQALDQQVIQQHVEKLCAAHESRERWSDTTVKAGGLIIVGYFTWLAVQKYYGVPQTLQEKLGSADPEALHALAQALSAYNESQQSWWHPSATIKWVGQGIVSSLVLQGLQPFFSTVSNYFSPCVTIPRAQTWFLSERASEQHRTSDTVIVNQDMARFIENIAGVEYAYTQHNAALLRQTYEYLIAHITYTLETLPTYIPAYKKVLGNGLIQQLVTLYATMHDDASKNICNPVCMDQFKDAVRALRHNFSVYCL